MMLMVGFLVLARSPSSMVNRSFMGIIIACCLWMGGRAGTFGSLTVEEAADWYLLSFTGLAFLPPAMYVFAASATASAHRRIKAIVLMLVLSGGLSLFGFVRPDTMASIVPNEYTGWYPRYSLGGYIYISYICVVATISCITLLVSPVPSSATQRREKSRIRLILIGLAAGFTGILDALPALGVHHPPTGHFSLLVGIALIGYAVGRYRVVILSPATTGEAIASTMQEALFFLDLEGRILFTNRALNSLLGYREGDLEGQSFDVLFAPDTPVKLDLGPRGRGLTGVRRAMVRTRTGVAVPTTITVNPHFDEEGETSGFVGLAQEQSEQERLVTRIRNLEREIEGVLSTSMFGVYMIWEGQLQFVNPRMAEIAGYTVDELIGMDVERMIHPDDRDVVMSRVAMRERGEDPDNHYVLRAIKKNGEVVELEIFSMGLERDARHIILGFAQDVTKQRKAEEEIQHVTGFNEWILRNAPVGIVMLDRQGRVDHANQRAAGLLGKSEGSELQGRHVRDTALGVDARLIQFFEHDPELQAGEERRLENLNLRTDEGRELGISLAQAPAMMGSGEGYLLVLEDRDGVAPERPGSFAGEAREWISLLVGGFARDVEGLLGGIVGYASLARALMPGEEKVSGYIDAITQSAQRTLEIIRQFGESRFDVANPDEDVSINEVLVEAMDEAEGLANPSIKIKCSMKRDLPRVKGDRAQLREMFYHLGLNALESMASGGHLEVETEEVHLDGYEQGRQEGSRTGDYVCIQFRDSGRGISEDVLERVFDPFFTTERERGKAGLGLWLARSVASRHQGTILVESREGQGSTFRVCLPAVSSEGSQEHDPASSARETGGRILIVDDEPAVREVGSELLQELGYEVLTAPDGKAALEVFDQNPGVDVVVLDMVMPKLDGEGTFHALQKKDPDIKVVISSGYTEDEKVRGLLELGALAFVQKPYRAQTLADAVEDAMALKKT
jgi:PAS domain S-box-containing protein